MITNYIENTLDIGDDLTGFMPACEALNSNPEKFPDWFVDRSICGTGGLWSWGRNPYGGSGLGDLVNRSSPVQVGSLTNWKYLSKYAGGVDSVGNSDDHFCSLKTDGTLWTCGANFHGQLGLGDLVHRSSPVQVGSLTNWSNVSSGAGTSCAVKTDGTLWSWGNNYNGELGLGDIVHRSSPVQVGSLTNWKQVSVSITTTNTLEGRFCFAIKTDGTLWAWGDNTYGQLGENDLVHRSSPVQVGTLTNWKQVSCARGFVSFIKTDGTLWSCGDNIRGQLGLGDRTGRSSPVQVGTLTNWKQVSSGGNQSVAIKTDGTLWSWGINTFGELGLGDIVHRSSPVQVGSLTNWKNISAGDDETFTLKTDGTLWTFGSNNVGQLGHGDVIPRSSPVQVGSLTDWKQVSGSSAIK